MATVREILGFIEEILVPVAEDELHVSRLCRRRERHCTLNLVARLLVAVVGITLEYGAAIVVDGIHAGRTRFLLHVDFHPAPVRRGSLCDKPLHSERRTLHMANIYNVVNAILLGDPRTCRPVRILARTLFRRREIPIADTACLTRIVPHNLEP